MARPGDPAGQQAPCSLVCVRAEGCDVSTLPLETRTIGLAPDRKIVIGREQQVGFFEGVLPKEHQAFISRAHFELRPVAGTLECFEIVNLSGHPLLLGQQLLKQHEQGTLRSPGSICFQRPSAPGGSGQPTPFLQLDLVVNAPQPAATQQPAAAQQRQQFPKWACTGPPTPFTLVCVRAEGCDIGTLPTETRTIGLAMNTKIVIGREHQVGFFEGILPSESYGFISRAHFELAPVAGCIDSFEITNLSGHRILLGLQQQLSKHERGTLQYPGSICFMATAPGDPSGKPTPLLQLDLVRSDVLQIQGAQTVQCLKPQPNSQAAPRHEIGRAADQRSVGDGYAHQSQRPPEAAWQKDTVGAAKPHDAAGEGYGYQMHNTQDYDYKRPPAATDAERSAAVGALRGDDASRPRATESSVPARDVQPLPTDKVCTAPFWLELNGTAIRDDFPRERRRIDGELVGLVVGRNHQRELHQEALKEGISQFVSRSHFRIDHRRGSFELVAVSENPLWRVRQGDCVEAVKGQPGLPLADLDVIQLFTGASDCTPDGPGNKGSFWWLFRAPSAASGTNNTAAPSEGLSEATVVIKRTADVGGPGARSDRMAPQEPGSVPSPSQKASEKWAVDSEEQIDVAPRPKVRSRRPAI
eukprot:gnl/TRDRNA2_/TRDRNA2_188152_c0_seq1.p1 gnl/TRDRNA2_/TRDRNA2_188152_c0~~gnl/TRDRNA2_/TRDRNA2_188152_c0_seq1.p1  ORF type:complete len:641 (-),score=87.47 gnl/TRDRNA2_/TRDRNA2_188152_c0_seq1:94-2016(-)